MLSILLSLLESLEEKAVLPLTGVKNSSMRRMERMGDDEVTEGGVMDTSEISDTFELTRIAVVGVDLIGAVIWIDFFFFCLGDDETGTGTGAESLIGEEGMRTRATVDLGNLLTFVNSSPINFIH